MQDAWAATGPHGEPTRRVWLRTSTLDAAHALDNYLARGLAIFHQVQREKEVPDGFDPAGSGATEVG